MGLKIVGAIIICLLSFGCAPKYITAPAKAEFPEISFTSIEPYELALDLPVIPKPKKTLMDANFNIVTDPEMAKYIVFVPEEFNKYVAKLQEIKTLKEILYKQEDLVNVYIRLVNSHKEFLALERAKAQAYRNMWVDSENAYRDERYQGQLNDYFYKGLLGVLTVGGIAAIIMLL